MEKENHKVCTKVQTQHWPEYDRVLIVAIDDEGELLGTVQLESWPNEQD